MALQQLEQMVLSFQNALVVAMEEVDQLRTQVFSETAKIQRESVDGQEALSRQQQQIQKQMQNLLSTVGNVTTPAAASSSSKSPGRWPEGPTDLLSRVEFLESAMRAMQERREATPVAVEAFMHQTQRSVDTAVQSMQRMQGDVQRALGETSAKSHADVVALNDKLDRHDGAVREVETKLKAVHNLVGQMNQRLQSVEENVSQLDAEQNDVTQAIAAIRDAIRKKAAATSPVRELPHPNTSSFESVLNPPASRSELESHVAERSTMLREEILQAVDQRFVQFQRQQMRNAAPQAQAAVVPNALDQRSAQQEAQTIRQDVTRCVSQIERLMDEQQRLAQQQHICLQTSQRVESALDAARDKLDLDLQTEIQRFDSLQKSFFSRQEQIMASERHQLMVKLTSEVQRVHQRHTEDLQKAEFRRLDDLRVAQVTLRDDFNTFSERQRDELHNVKNGIDERMRNLSEELKTFVANEVTQQNDASRRTHHTASDELRKTALKTMDDVKRVKQLIDETSSRLSEQNKALHNRVQHILDAEVHRFDHIAFEFTAKLQKQIDEEVSRVALTHGSNVSRDVEAHREATSRDIRAVKEELASLRSSLQSIVVPTSTLSTIDARLDVVRRDVLDIHESMSRIHESEFRIQHNLSNDVKTYVESVKNEIVRDVGQQLIRFDQILVDLSQEVASRSSDVKLLLTHRPATPTAVQQQHNNNSRRNEEEGRQAPSSKHLKPGSSSGGGSGPEPRSSSIFPDEDDEFLPTAARGPQRSNMSGSHHHHPPKEREEAYSSRPLGGLFRSDGNGSGSAAGLVSTPAPHQHEFGSPRGGGTTATGSGRQSFFAPSAPITNAGDQRVDPLVGVFTTMDTATSYE